MVPVEGTLPDGSKFPNRTAYTVTVSPANLEMQITEYVKDGNPQERQLLAWVAEQAVELDRKRVVDGETWYPLSDGTAVRVFDAPPEHRTDPVRLPFYALRDAGSRSRQPSWVCERNGVTTNGRLWFIA